MTQTPAGQSVLVDNSNTLAVSSSVRKCVLNHVLDDQDTTMMWVDYTGLAGTTISVDVNTESWMRLPRDAAADGSASIAATTMYSSNTDYLHSIAVSSSAKPVPLPRAGVAGGVVIYFDTTQLKFRLDGNDVALDYPSTLTCIPSSTTNQNIFVTDGVSSITIGRRTGTTIDCMQVLRFDWTVDPPAQSMLHVSDGVGTSIAEFHDTEEDHMFGDLLWTVNGKPCWLSGFNLLLGTSMENPLGVTTTGTTMSSVTAGQHGLDIFMRVDLDGVLWVGDWGHDNGGLFNCAEDTELGIASTSITLAGTDTHGPGNSILLRLCWAHGDRLRRLPSRKCLRRLRSCGRLCNRLRQLHPGCASCARRRHGCCCHPLSGLP
jgi:hypothetical protein